MDHFGRLGAAYRETDPANANLQTIVADLISGEYSHPLAVVAAGAGVGIRRRVGTKKAYPWQPGGL